MLLLVPTSSQVIGEPSRHTRKSVWKERKKTQFVKFSAVRFAVSKPAVVQQHKGTEQWDILHLLRSLLPTCATVEKGYCELSSSQFFFFIIFLRDSFFLSVSPATETQAALSKGFLTREELFMPTMSRF